MPKHAPSHDMPSTPKRNRLAVLKTPSARNMTPSPRQSTKRKTPFQPLDLAKRKKRRLFDGEHYTSDQVTGLKIQIVEKIEQEQDVAKLEEILKILE